MQLLKSNCPYCAHEVETTIEHLEDPIVCPSCQKPFEIEVPSVQVTSVREVDSTAAEDSASFAQQLEERELFVVHPAVLRARPLGTLVVIGVLAISLYAMWASWASDVADVDLPNGEPINWLLWIGVGGLLGGIGAIGYWKLQSMFTTLTITDERTIFQQGIVARDTSEVQHDDVRNLQLDQSFMQRILGVGDIGISSSGQDDLEIVARRMPAPQQLAETIRRNQR